MKSSLRKLRGLTQNHHKSEPKDKKRLQAKQDELLQACQDMQDMRECYDSLLSAAAATANSAYEFSEALQEMGTCLLQKTSLNDDEDSGKVLLMLGKVQFELHKLLDSYRAHIIQTITTPSDSLLKELQIVEEMKCQCDYKRDSYNNMLEAHKERGRSKHAKNEPISLQQLQSAQEEYDEEASLFIFRLESLKKGQSRSLLTQAARHYAAQLHFFKKGVKTLEVVEPHVKVASKEQHIDYQFSELEDNSLDPGDDDEYSYDESGDGELSFDYGQTEQSHTALPESRNLMELDQVDRRTSFTFSMETSEQDSVDKSQPEVLTYNRGPTAGSHSAPLLPNMKVELSDKMKQTESSRHKFLTYALPTPSDAKILPTGSRDSFSVGQTEGKVGWPTQLWYSSPLKPDKFLKDIRDEKESALDRSKGQSTVKEGNTRMPPPLAEELTRSHSSSMSEAKKIKRQAVSGPLTDSRDLVDHTPSKSATPMRIPPPRRSVSPNSSPPLSSPKISELHELPRPPMVTANPRRPTSLIGHSAPLISRGADIPTTSKVPSMVTQKASPLPIPPKSMPRSFSIPSSGQRTPTISSANPQSPFIMRT